MQILYLIWTLKKNMIPSGYMDMQKIIQLASENKQKEIITPRFDAIGLVPRTSVL